MPRNVRQLKADLRREGCFWRPGKGSHTVWGHPLVRDTVTLSGNDGDDAKPYQEKRVRDLIDAIRRAKGRP